MKTTIGTKSPLYGANRGTEKNDLAKIANHLSSNEMMILSDDSIQEIKVSEIRIRSGSWIDGIQFVYKITKDNKISFVEGHKFGGNGGSETVIKLTDDEYLVKMNGYYGDSSWFGNVDKLRIWTYSKSQGRVNLKGEFGGAWRTTEFEIASDKLTYPLICFFGRCSGGSLSGLGMYESNVSLLEVKKEKDTYQKAQIVTPPPYRRNEF